jgi:hypothetical protein
MNTNADPNPRFFGTGKFMGISYYVSAGTDGSFCEAGWVQNNLGLYTSFGGTMFFDNIGTGAGRISAANANWTGFLSGNRTSNPQSDVYKANSVTPFANIATTGADNIAWPNIAGSFVFFFANNNGGNTALQFTTRKMSFVSTHFGLSAADCQTLYNAVQAFRVALGGGFV